METYTVDADWLFLCKHAVQNQDWQGDSLSASQLALANVGYAGMLYSL
jgi:hypothetical protein